MDGPLNDIDAVRRVLTSRFGVPGGNITILRNRQATHSQIRAAFAALNAKINADDWVYIHYSGHGSVASDPNDPRGEDQTWVPFGARLGRNDEDDWDILDKEINSWLYPIYQRTSKVLFVSDSCHSASVSRGSVKGVRSVKPDLRPHPLLGKVPAFPNPKVGIRIGAARDFESAVELDPTKGGSCAGSKNCAGVFTMYWTQGMLKAQPTESWKEIFDRTATLVSTQRGVAQRPQIEGQSDQLVFGGGFSAAPPSVSVTEVDQSRRSAKLSAGTLSGVTMGSTFRPVTSSGSGVAVAKLKIVNVGLFESTAAITSGAVLLGDLFSEESHQYANRPVRLFVGGDFEADIDKENIEKLRGALSALQGFTLVDDRLAADWLAYVVRPTPQNTGHSTSSALTLPSPSTKPIDIIPELVLVSPQGLLMNKRMRIPLTSAESFLQLADNLKKFVWAREVRRLGEGGTGISVDVHVKLYRPRPSCAPSCSTWDFVGTSKLTSMSFAPSFGDRLQFQLHNSETTKSIYAYIIAIGPSAEVQILFPRRDENQDTARLDPQQTVNASTTYTLDEEGTESVIVLSTDSPINAQMLSQASFAAARGARSSSPIEILLSSVANGRGSIGVTVDAWSGTSAEFEIRRAN
ncbi:caspase family protein [Bradyrhizobium sp. CCGB12]|nr:caspase family protein [Bradyrhizobium sp. CCGB12]